MANIKKYIIEAFQKLFLLNEIAKSKSNWKSNRRKKAFNRGFNYVMTSYFIYNVKLENINDSVELGKYFDVGDMEQAFDSGAQEALNIIWMQTGHSKGFFKDNAK